MLSRLRLFKALSPVCETNFWANSVDDICGYKLLHLLQYGHSDIVIYIVSCLDFFGLCTSE